jgi:hypothetical protein
MKTYALLINLLNHIWFNFKNAAFFLHNACVRLEVSHSEGRIFP